MDVDDDQLRGRSRATRGQILVVEDDRALAQVLAVNLRLAGLQVDVVHDGALALEYLDETVPDLILLDLLLPKVDGWEVFRRINEQPWSDDVSVIVLTALVQDRNVLKGWQMGADAYMTKPFDPEDLVNTVESLLDRRSGPARQQVEPPFRDK